MATLPPAGWYDDPELADQLRYWDGARWTDHRTSPSSASAADASEIRLIDVGDLIEEVFEDIWRCRRALANFAGTHIIAWLIGSLVIAWAVDDLVWVDGSFQRVHEGRIAIAVVALLCIAAISVGLFNALVHQFLRARRHRLHGTALATDLESFRAGIRATPLVLLWTIASIALLAVALVASVLLASLGPVVAVPVALAWVPLTAFLYVKLQFMVASLVAPVPDQGPVRSSAAVSADGRFWGVFGRVILVVVVSGIASFGVGLPFLGLSMRGVDEQALVLTDEADDIVFVDIGGLARAGGFSGGLNALGAAIPQATGSVLIAASVAALYTNVHGRRMGII